MGMTFDVLVDSRHVGNTCMRWDWRTLQWTMDGVQFNSSRGCQSAHFGYIGLFDLPTTTTTTTTTTQTTGNGTSDNQPTTTLAQPTGVANDASTFASSIRLSNMLFLIYL